MDDTNGAARHDTDGDLRLAVDHVVVTISPGHGGRVAAIDVGGRPLLVAGDGDSHPMTWGSFPMVPWAGRVRHGRFAFDGAEHQLPLDLPPHAIHGTGYRTAWRVERSDARTATLACDLDWEFGGTAQQRFVLAPGSLRCELSAIAGAVAMPAELGWHPWFVEPVDLRFSPRSMYVRDAEGIPDGRLVVPPPGPWDDCFVNVDPVELVYDELTVTLRADCADWVVYDEPEGSICVEPQSGPPDAFNLRPRRLAPGEALTRVFEISWTGTAVT